MLSRILVLTWSPKAKSKWSLRIFMMQFHFQDYHPFVNWLCQLVYPPWEEVSYTIYVECIVSVSDVSLPFLSISFLLFMCHFFTLFYLQFLIIITSLFLASKQHPLHPAGTHRPNLFFPLYYKLIFCSYFYEGKASTFLCVEDEKPYHCSAVYASALHAISLPFRMEPLGPSADSCYFSGAVDIHGVVEILAGQARQNRVTILDVAMPAPSLTGNIWMAFTFKPWL